MAHTGIHDTNRTQSYLGSGQVDDSGGCVTNACRFLAAAAARNTTHQVGLHTQHTPVRTDSDKDRKSNAGQMSVV